ncbi:crotonase/enoyl-CoA hydratase family protein [Marinobacter sp. tcs-11]|jgi:enoyl-CoA hydratase/carnithine racemase|uniref:crotonase/enoyl-CoA hydratase family protein n=1 Tax=Marinobacter sp. tcs-11 TaxID=1742860 RepID=UPI000C5BB4CB|nr:crotonase/enoyl-CoA hydratase family protein [Marinobacter sp. tcs-11]MAL32014.1 enoyl-CoA hydratase [Marinobacter sp.]|tara:strand:+ start:272 stop:1051 length:780 start_codon:yes stop_codon:yes gene_type:complete
MPLVNVEKQGHILKIGLNRPEKMNAMNRAMYHEIAAAYYQLQHDPELRVAVMYAEGDHFTSGLQLDDWAGVFANGKGIEPGEGELDPFDITGDSLTKPVVFAAQGICFTCGVEMMLNTDIRVAAKGTRFAQLEVKRGIFACGGATIRLQREIGWGNAQRYLLTGDEWTAEQAYQWGLIQELVEPGEQLNKAMEIAEKIARAAPLGVQGSLKSSKIAVSEGQEAAKERLFPELRPVMASEDVKEGIQSFLERREAVFKGK